MESSATEKRRPLGALAAGAGAGSTLAAVLASSCCVPVVAPLIVAVLGASGAAWVAGLKPYSPYLLAGSFALLLFGLWTVYRPRPACSPEDCPAAVGRGVKAGLWLSMAVWILAALLTLFFTRS